MTHTKSFPVSAVLSATTGSLVAPAVGDVYELAQWMTGGPVWTHQLVIILDPIRAELLRQFPELTSIKFDSSYVPAGASREEARAGCEAWVERQVELLGKTHYDVAPFPPGSEWSGRDPVEDLVGLVGEEKVVVVAMDDDLH